ncbi:MAG: hypothetical protein H7836_16155, partial [Magnetococcus sp. YQC-3]
RKAGSLISRVAPYVAPAIYGARALYRGYKGYKKGGIKRALKQAIGVKYRKKRVYRYPSLAIRSYQGSSSRYDTGTYTPLKYASTGVREDKFLDYYENTPNNIVTFNASSTTCTRTFNQIIAGSGYNQRIGLNIFAKNLTVTGFINWADGTTAVPPTVYTRARVIVFLDKFSDNTEVQPTWLLADVSSTPAAIISDYNNTKFKDRFIILKDTLFDYNPSDNNKKDMVKIQWNFKINMWCNYYDSGAQTWTKNSIKIMAFNDSGVGALTQTLTYQYRLTFWG